MKHKSLNADYLVIGSGLAGLASAIVLSEYGSVLIVTKQEVTDGSSALAQGGIAAVLSPEDSYTSHINDTMTAGAHENTLDAVEMMVREGPDTVQWLASLGVPFDMADKKFSLGREGGHSTYRVAHATDFSGREIEHALWNVARSRPSISCWDHAYAASLIVHNGRCIGAKVIRDGYMISCMSRFVVLATGGLGQIYEQTTNPSVSTGDGISLAIEAGAQVKDLAFIQFHPTALDSNETPKFLLSEALRGDGAYLLSARGERFMESADPRKELAPRDIVAREIFSQQKYGPVTLDIRHRGEAYLKKRFANIYASLKTRGYDLAHDFIPVTPAAHYSCGGVSVDTDGRTSIPGLFAMGEVSCTGIHGANRLASNSLLEATVFPRHLAKYARIEDIGKRVDSHDEIERVPEDTEEIRDMLIHVRKRIKHTMWHYVGIERTRDGLQSAQDILEAMLGEFPKTSSVYGRETKHMLVTANAVVSDALLRPRSIGAHWLVQ